MHLLVCDTKWILKMHGATIKKKIIYITFNSGLKHNFLKVELSLTEDRWEQRSVCTWQRINAWNNEDIWRTEALDCSANPAMITWMWSAMWQDASWGTGWQWQCDVECVAWLAPPCRAVWVREPSSSHDKRRMWPTQSMNSRGLKMN